jgi:hypothetical protein
MDDLGAIHAKLKDEAGKKMSMVKVAKQVGPIVASLTSALSNIRSRSN